MTGTTGHVFPIRLHPMSSTSDEVSPISDRFFVYNKLKLECSHSVLLIFLFSGNGSCANQRCSLKHAGAKRPIIKPRQRSGDFKQFERLKTDGESFMPGNVSTTWCIIHFLKRSTIVLLVLLSWGAAHPRPPAQASISNLFCTFGTSGLDF
jgi:hypothetical protein